MKKILLLGALLILGTVSFGKSEIMQEDAGKYSGNTSLQLISEGNAVAVTSDVWLEIMPMMSKGPNGASIEFDFGELQKGQIAVTEGSFYAEVKEYGNNQGTTPFKRLKFKGVHDGQGNMDVGEIYVALRKNGGGVDNEGATITSDVMVPGSSAKDAEITYNLVGNKGGLVGSSDRYEGYITSTIVVEKNANPGEFYDTGVALVVKVNQIEGTN